MTPLTGTDEFTVLYVPQEWDEGSPVIQATLLAIPVTVSRRISVLTERKSKTTWLLPPARRTATISKDLTGDHRPSQGSVDGGSRLVTLTPSMEGIPPQLLAQLIAPPQMIQRPSFL